MHVSAPFHTRPPPLAEAIGKHAMGGLWVYVRDERPDVGDAAPAVLYRHAPDRKGMRSQGHLQGFAGYLHADGYVGLVKLYADCPGKRAAIIGVACWAHVRRKFFDVGGSPGSEEFAEAMTEPRHPERKRLIEWYGRVFDPEDIDLPTVQANIAKLARRRAIGKAAFAKSRRSES